MRGKITDINAAKTILQEYDQFNKKPFIDNNQNPWHEFINQKNQNSEYNLDIDCFSGINFNNIWISSKQETANKEVFVLNTGSLEYIDFSGASFDNMNFTHINLTYACFHGAIHNSNSYGLEVDLSFSRFIECQKANGNNSASVKNGLIIHNTDLKDQDSKRFFGKNLTTTNSINDINLLLQNVGQIKSMDTYRSYYLFAKDLMEDNVPSFKIENNEKNILRDVVARASENEQKYGAPYCQSINKLNNFLKFPTDNISAKEYERLYQKAKSLIHSPEEDIPYDKKQLLTNTIHIISSFTAKNLPIGKMSIAEFYSEAIKVGGVESLNSNRKKEQNKNNKDLLQINM